MKTSKRSNDFMEKRKYERKACSASVGYAFLDKNHTAIIENISDEGAFLDTLNPVTVGHDIAMKIQLEKDQQPIMIIGEVAWNSPRGMGVKFKMGFDSSLIQYLVDNM